MNIRCPHCQTLFRVDPARVPPRGIRARCARCGGTFQIAGTSAPDTPSHGGAPTPAAPTGGSWRGEPQSRPDAGAAPAPGRRAATESRDAFARPSGQERPATGAGTGGGEGAGRGAASAPAGAGTAQPTSAAGAGTAQPDAPRRPVFGSRDPTARAQRIARALVSDIVAYHPERRDQALEAGTLRSEFRDEIMKSWDEYVAQVGQETAKSTPFFRQALNDILARGQAVF